VARVAPVGARGFAEAGVGGEVARDDGVQDDQHPEGNDEEQRDGGDEVEGGPKRIRLGEADGHHGAVEVLLEPVLGHSQNRAATERKRAAAALVTFWLGPKTKNRR
jgi:hypothetical protein